MNEDKLISVIFLLLAASFTGLLVLLICAVSNGAFL